MTASRYDDALSALRTRIEDLTAWRHRVEPDACARRRAADAVDAVDAMLGELYRARTAIEPYDP